MGIKTKLKHAISFLLHGEPKQVIAKVVTLAPSELLKQRCALITGGTSGIGYSIAEAYLKAGIKAVVITGRSQEKVDIACLAWRGTKISREICQTRNRKPARSLALLSFPL